MGANDGATLDVSLPETLASILNEPAQGKQHRDEHQYIEVLAGPQRGMRPQHESVGATPIRST